MPRRFSISSAAALEMSSVTADGAGCDAFGAEARWPGRSAARRRRSCRSSAARRRRVWRPWPRGRPAGRRARRRCCRIAAPWARPGPDQAGEGRVVPRAAADDHGDLPAGAGLLRTTPPGTRRTSRAWAATKPSSISSANAAGSLNSRVIGPTRSPRRGNHRRRGDGGIGAFIAGPCGPATPSARRTAPSVRRRRTWAGRRSR